jgi:hypothetical protein
MSVVYTAFLVFGLLISGKKMHRQRWWHYGWASGNTKGVGLRSDRAVVVTFYCRCFDPIDS